MSAFLLADYTVKVNSDKFLKFAEQNFDKHKSRVILDLKTRKSNIQNRVDPLSKKLRILPIISN